MYLAVEQVAHQHSALGTLLYMIGVAALLFVFRRSIVLRIQRRRAAKQLTPLHLSATPQRTIENIDARRWLDQARSAVRFSRNAVALSAGQSTFLRDLSNWQNSRRRGWHDG